MRKRNHGIVFVSVYRTKAERRFVRAAQHRTDNRQFYQHGISNIDAVIETIEHVLLIN